MQNLTIDSVCTKGPIYPVLIDFENGYPKEQFGITCAVLLLDKDRSRTVATEVSEQAYAGREKIEDSGKTLMLVKNRKTGKTRLIETGYAELKPFTKTDLEDLERERSKSALSKKINTKKHNELTSCNKAIQTESDTNQINGCLKRQESVRSMQSLNLSINNPTEVAAFTFDSTTKAESVMNHKRKVSIEQIRNETVVNNDTLCNLKIDEKNVQQPKAPVSAPNAFTISHPTAPRKTPKVKNNPNDFFVPPYNRNATRVEEIYPVEEILSTHEYEKIYSELQGKNYAADMHPYVQCLVQDKILSPRLTVLAVYASEIIKLKQGKKSITYCHSKTLANMLVWKLKKLSERKFINGLNSWDRKVCDSIALLLIINNFKLELKPLCAALHLSDVETKISLVGASIISNDGEDMVQLKLQSVQENIDYDLQTVTEQEINIADLDLYILPRDRESTDDLDCLQQHGSNTSEMSMKFNKHNKKKRKKSEGDVQTESIEMENRNYNHSANQEDNVDYLDSLQLRNSASDMNPSKKKKKKGVKAKDDVPTDSEEMENKNPNVTNNQLHTHNENVLDDLYILPRYREANECGSESLEQQHNSSTLEISRKSRRHKNKKRTKYNVQTDSKDMENGNSYVSVHDLDASSHDKSDSDDLYILPKSHKRKMLKGEKAKDFVVTDAKDMENGNPSYPDAVDQLNLLSYDSIGSDNLYILQERGKTPFDSKSTFDSESGFDSESTSDSSSLGLGRKYRKVKNKRQKPKDIIQTKSRQMEKGSHNGSTEQLDISAHDGNALHNLHILPHDREENECDSESFQQQPDSNLLEINRISKKHIKEDHENDNIQIDAEEMGNGNHNITADQTHDENRKSKKHKNMEKQKHNIQTESEDIKNRNYNVTTDHTHYENVDYVYIPPINKEATKVEDVYPIDEILSDDEYKKIYSELQGVEYELNPYVQSVVKGKNLSPKLTVLALYVTELIKLLHYKREATRMIDFILCHCSQTLDNIILKYFTTFQKYTNVSVCLTSLIRIKTEPLRDKITCHIIVFMLILGDFKLDLEPLYRALEQKSLNCQVIKNLVPLLGASIVDRQKRTFIQLSLPLRLKSLLDRSKLVKLYYVPPVNSKASRVEDIYPVEKILSEYEYEKIYLELQKNFDAKHLHPYIQSLIQTKTLSPKLTVLAVYASDLLKFNQVRYLGKHLVISKHSETLNDILIREFTEITKAHKTGKLKRVRSPPLIIKLVCHVTVFALILNNFEVKLEPLQACCLFRLRVHLKIVGASVVDSEDGKTLQLKLPKLAPPTVTNKDLPEEKKSDFEQSLKGVTLVLSTEKVKGNAGDIVHYIRSNDEHTVDFYIPPVNRETDEIGEMYPLEKILSQSEYKMIYMELQKSDYAEDLHPYVKSLLRDRNLSPNLTVLALYASELLKFLHYTFPHIRYMKTLCCHSATLDNIMKKEFTVITKFCKEKNSVSTQRFRTQPLKDKLVCHLLVFMLILNDFKLELEPLYSAIKVGGVYYARYFSLIGAKVVNADGLEFRRIPSKKLLAATKESAKI